MQGGIRDKEFSIGTLIAAVAVEMGSTSKELLLGKGTDERRGAERREGKTQQDGSTERYFLQVLCHPPPHVEW